MGEVPPELAGHPDRLKWNARYSEGYQASFEAHLLAVRALSLPLPGGPVLELACGPSGSALLAAGSGQSVTAVDASDVALRLLQEEARRRDVADRITLIQADLQTWRPEAGHYALVLCTGFWDRGVFAAAAEAVATGGLIAWESVNREILLRRPDFNEQWVVSPGEPAALLPPGFEVIEQVELRDGRARTELMARRQSTPSRS